MDALELSQQVEERYRQYLTTLFEFRDPEFRRSFLEALGKGQLSRGPYLEATPVFRRGTVPRDLCRYLLPATPDPGFLQALRGERPLYTHQEQAIRAVDAGRNVVVATGTASGKTEAFLYPILLHLYREALAGDLGPGIRALILYPMNALANDQRERLGDICSRLRSGGSRLGLTFGQYVGETPEDGRDSRRNAQDHNRRRLPGELVFRSEIRATPPHILLTNYSMLEYLLLRPDDSPLFDDGRARQWAFLVLDEAHQYRGSRGTEMAMLLRRLKQRLTAGGSTGPLRCVATSASLAGGRDDRAAVATFATSLFGEPVADSDVFLGDTQVPPDLPERELSNSDYTSLALALGDTEWRPVFDRIAQKVDLLSLRSGDAAQALAGILQRDRRASNLRKLIAGSPREVTKVAADVFPDVEPSARLQALSRLVELLVRALDPDSAAPLLSVRYHLFLRSLEGAYVSYWPKKAVRLDRQFESNGDGAWFEVALCRECGQLYLVGVIKGDKLVEAVRDPGDPTFGVTYLRPLEGAADEVEDSRATHHLCTRCGRLQRTPPSCGHPEVLPLRKEDPPKDEDRSDQIGRCGTCGYTAAGRDPVREVVHGTDGPNAVIATTLLQKLPEARRKILAFADGRQEAAFFAWYMEDSYREISHRSFLVKAVQALASHAPGGASLKELALSLRDIMRANGALPPAAGDLEALREAWTIVYQEFLTDEPRISLEGVGLLRWAPTWPSGLTPPALLREPPWSLTEDDVYNLMAVLLDSVRIERAVEVRTSPGVSLTWTDLRLQASQLSVRIGDPQGRISVRAWDGRHGRRARYLASLLAVRGVPQDDALDRSQEALRVLWELLTRQYGSSEGDNLLPRQNETRRLNPDWWRVRLVAPEEIVFQCDTCSRLQILSVRRRCTRNRCSGVVQPIRVDALGTNHYRDLYQSSLPASLRFEEHTAQLQSEKARHFQQEFREGKIHLLSCSTTFELGVDLGDLDVIFLRNVPPEAFNYVQRVGRAGRRGGHPGFAITYCRRSPHDLYHFSQPERILSGATRPPVLTLGNEKIVIRHVAATALSFFLRAFPMRFGAVSGFFRDLLSPSATADLRSFLFANRPLLEQTLKQIAPSQLGWSLGLHDGSWIERIAGADSSLAAAELQISSDYRLIKHLESSAAGSGQYTTAQWARSRAETIAGEDMLSYLSRKAVIPKYGFPVDVVDLSLQPTRQTTVQTEIALQRDLSLAVAEFAPTSKVVANKRVWTSYGLRKVVEKEWPRKYYRRCTRHNVFQQWSLGEEAPPSPCHDALPPREYVIPRFGFVADRRGGETPTSRPARVFTTRPYFSRPLGPPAATVSIPLDRPLVTITKASPGQMVVLCEGRRSEGFYVCNQCGAGFRVHQRSHETPYGQPCQGRPTNLSLGHEFVTDVLKLQMHIPAESTTSPVWFAYSLAFALVEGAAEVLEVPSTDLSAAVGHAGDDGGVPLIVLYDNVPGGAGLVARVEDPTVLKTTFEAARGRVEGLCGCGDDTSCYGCLRTYRNQFAHQHLRRGAAKAYLAMLLDSWR